MTPALTTTQADFDRLARLADAAGWDHNTHYHRWLLRHVPTPCEAALDVGCGTGRFARGLASRSAHVLGLDLSPEMIRVARGQSAEFPTITFQVADVLAWEWPRAHFDCIATVATLHHLPLGETLARMRDALTPGGALLVLDLFQTENWADMLWSVPAMSVSLALRLLHNRRLSDPPAVRAAWAEHSKHDVYPTLRQVRQLCAEILPGAEVRRHLLWRYSIVWKKPEVETRR